MMGQEHISYILKYASLSVDFLCDPNQSSIDTALSLLKQDQADIKSPTVVSDEKELLQHVYDIDLLVIVSQLLS